MNPISLLRADVLGAGGCAAAEAGYDPGLVEVEVAPKRPKRTRKVIVGEPDLIAAK